MSGEKARLRLLKRAFRLYKLLKTQKWITTNIIMREFECGQRTALRYIRAAEEEGWIIVQFSSEPAKRGARFYISRLF